MPNTDKLFTAIARQHLNVETLETRKRDCLDFHDCSVWGIKSALQAAYDAGRDGRTAPNFTRMKKPKGYKEKQSDDMFLGLVHASYREMVAAFGKPQKGDGYKSEVVWKVKLDDLVEVEIYNWKNSKTYDRSNPRIQAVRDWSVNGTDSDAIEWVKGALGQETK